MRFLKAISRSLRSSIHGCGSEYKRRRYERRPACATTIRGDAVSFVSLWSSCGFSLREWPSVNLSARTSRRMKSPAGWKQPCRRSANSERPIYFESAFERTNDGSLTGRRVLRLVRTSVGYESSPGSSTSFVTALPAQAWLSGSSIPALTSTTARRPISWMTQISLSSCSPLRPRRAETSQLKTRLGTDRFPACQLRDATLVRREFLRRALQRLGRRLHAVLKPASADAVG
jgi:hypothetical protein